MGSSPTVRPGRRSAVSCTSRALRRASSRRRSCFRSRWSDFSIVVRGNSLKRPLDRRIHLLAKMMDCRVKPGNDQLGGVMLDLNNRPGGPNLIVTAKTAHKVHFLDAATLTLSATIDMPGSTHELALSSDGRTAYGT